MENEKQERYIRFREDRNSYEIQLRPKVDGKTISIVRTAKSMEKAIEIRDNLMDLYKMDKALLLAVVGRKKEEKPKKVDKIILLKNSILRWYKYRKKPFIEESTIESYNTMIFVHIYPILGELNVKKIDSDIIQTFLMSLLKNGNKHVCKKSDELSIKYVQKIRTFLKSYFNYLVEQEIITKNPCINTKLPKQRKVERAYFSEDAKRKFMDHLRKNNYGKYFLFKMYFETGCRRGEILGIPWRNVNFVKKSIFIKQTVIKDIENFKGKIKGTPKTEASIRWVRLSDKTMYTLKIMYELQKRNELDFSEDTLIFHKKDGSCYTPASISQCFKRYVRILGLDERLSLHCTRHTMAKILLKEKVPLPTIQHIGGWADVTTLLNTYGHSDIEEETDAMKYLSV